MKVFLSHSSKDKWAARRIARDIEAAGATPFLDERDIKTGESVDSSIRAHLVDSDHFLLLLSPASLKSEWVLMELGGALALGKTIVPILLYVGANELPQAISLTLARDINEVEKYFEELRALTTRGPGRATRKLKHQRSRRKTKSQGSSFLQPGSLVKIVTNQPPTVYRPERRDVKWIDRMDQFLGRTAKVTAVDRDGDAILDVDPQLSWAPEWLAPVDGGN